MFGKKTFTPTRLAIAATLILVIAIGLIIIVYNHDRLFKHQIKIDYPDGCEEEYINGELVTPECTEGRELLERQKNNSKWYLNITPMNLSLN